MTGQSEWIARFTADYHAKRAAYFDEVARKTTRPPAAHLVVLVEQHEPGPEISLPKNYRAALSLAQSTGWRAWGRRSVVAHPSRGVITVITLRCARHDERLWAAWHNGSFDSADYACAGMDSLEHLGWVATSTKRSVRDVLEGFYLPRAAPVVGTTAAVIEQDLATQRAAALGLAFLFFPETQIEVGAQ